MTQFGLDRLLSDASLRKPLAGRRLGLLAHPASVTSDLTHALDALAACEDLSVTSAFGPQHGLRGDKQDNMMESPDYLDPIHNIPVYSLYGEVRRPTPEMMESCDVVVIDLQDLGCRIYTFITTLLYILEEAAKTNKSVYVLDRPNPAGRPIEGMTLIPGWESFVGGGPMPMRHGLTMGEMGYWFVRHYGLDVDYHVITIDGWSPDAAPGFGWDVNRSWINPSPNAPTLNMARAYAGTVLLEGTTLSEGRGTTRALEILGAPDIDARSLLSRMQTIAPAWLEGTHLREIWFEPTFHKHAQALCHGIHIHADHTGYDHDAFKPWRVVALALKALRGLQPDYPIWRDFLYEYEEGKLAIDVINGGPFLRTWIDDPEATPGDLDAVATPDEAAWKDAQAEHFLYR
ncbi:MAG: DUF1343 domain-containing protein [Pseudomonadota bacterium]